MTSMHARRRDSACMWDISSDELETKQEQISETLQTLQLLLAKHGDRMTNEEKQEIESQLKELQESQCILSKEYERQQKEAKDLVDKVVSGTIDETTGTVYSIYESIVQGLIDYETGICLLEMQLIISGLVSPELKLCFDIEEAKNHTLIDEEIAIRLQELSDAKSMISSLSSVDFPIITAFEQGLLSETFTIQILDILLSCGCLYAPGTKEKLNVNKLFQRNLISTNLFSKLIDRQKAGKYLIDPITAEKVTLIEILQRCIKNKETGMRFLPVNVQEKGKIMLKSGRKISVIRAAHEGILEREILFRMLGAQMFSGGIIDPDSGRKMTLEESLQQGFIDQDTICGILTQQVKNGGIICPSTGKYLTVDEAVQCNLISYSSALLVLEAQRGFIGLIWPDTSEIFPISTSLQQGMISNELAQKILSNRQKIAGLYIPETSEILHLDAAANLGLIENNTATVLSSLQLHDKMPNIDVLDPTCKHALKWMSWNESHATTFDELSENKFAEEEEEALTHNPEHTKQLFISYLMINSYIDANTGERLLLFDEDLDEAASMLLESENIVRTAIISKKEFTKTISFPTELKQDENIWQVEPIASMNFDIMENKVCPSPSLLSSNTCNKDVQNEYEGQADINCKQGASFQFDKLETLDSNVDHGAIIHSCTENNNIQLCDILDSKVEDSIISVHNKPSIPCSQALLHAGNPRETNESQNELSDSDSFITPTNSEHDLTYAAVDEIQNTLHAEAYTYNKKNDNDTHPSNNDISKKIIIETILKPSCENIHDHFDNDSSDQEDEEGNGNVGFITQFGACRKIKCNEENTFEERDQAFTDSSSDEETYYYSDNEVEKLDTVRDHQFLETIIEEDSESNTCFEEEELSFKGEIDNHGEEAAMLNNGTKSIQYRSENIKNEEREDEYTESCFSETDIDCFITDETNSDEECYQSELSTHEHSFNSTVIYKPSQKEDNVILDCQETNSHSACRTHECNGDKELIDMEDSSDKNNHLGECTIIESSDVLQITYPLLAQDINIVTQNICERGQDLSTGYKVYCHSSDVENINTFVSEMDYEKAELDRLDDPQPNSLKYNTSDADVLDTISSVENYKDIVHSEPSILERETINYSDHLNEFVSNKNSLGSFLETDNKKRIEDTKTTPEVEEHANNFSNTSPIHIDTLSAIFDSLNLKNCNNNDDLNVNLNMIGSEKNLQMEDKSPENECTIGDLTSCLRECASAIQAMEQKGEIILTEGTLDSKDYSVTTNIRNISTETSHVTITNKENRSQDVNGGDNGSNNEQDSADSENANVVEITDVYTMQPKKESVNDLVILSNAENNSFIHNELQEKEIYFKDKTEKGSTLTQEKTLSSEPQCTQIDTDLKELNSIVQDQEVVYCNPTIFGLNKEHNQAVSPDAMQTHPNHQTENGSHACPKALLVLEPNHPKLISSQLEQIFHIPEESENKNKFEELLININKGLFPSEMMVYSSKSENQERKPDQTFVNTHPQSDKVAQAECAIRSEQNPYSEYHNDDHMYLNKNQETGTKEMRESEECVSSDSLSGTLTEKLCEHLTAVQDFKLHLDGLPAIGNNLETLKLQLEQMESFDSRLNEFSAAMKKDMICAESFLMATPDDLSLQHLKELNNCLLKAFAVVCEFSSEHAKQIASAVDTEMSKLAVSYQELLNKLHILSDWIQEKNDALCIPVNTDDVEIVKQKMQSILEESTFVSEKKMELETAAFDIQFLISEHAQDLSATQSKQLLRLLNTTQRSYQETHRKIKSQIDCLNGVLVAAQNLSDKKDAEVQLQEHKEKLQEICALLTQTENRLIGQQDSFHGSDSPADLQLCQSEYQELQKDMHAGASELAEIVKNTEKFLQEYGDKLSQEDRTAVEQKLKEAKAKFDFLNKRAEESKTQLDKAVISAIKKQTEKSAAVEQLEENKNRIDSLLDWLSNVDKEVQNGNSVPERKIQQNGTHYQDHGLNSLFDEVKEVNGNLIQTDGNKDTLSVHKQDDLTMQYQNAKAQHEKIVSQHQAVIIATQSAQALLEKQGQHLTSEEKIKLQKDIKELKAQYESTLFDSERKMKLIQTVQEELQKFSADCSEFENWLQESQHALGDLQTGAEDFAGIKVKFQTQKSFSEDVISHKGDLRYVTISGHRVLDAAKSCNKDEDNNNVNTLETCKIVQERLDLASEKYKSLHSKCNVLGNNLKDLVDKCQHYKEASSSLLKELQRSESIVNKRLSDPIAADTKNLQKQLEDTKVLCEQVSAHQADVEKLKKAANVLIDTNGGLLRNNDEIHKPLDDIMGKYNTLSQSVNDWNEKLQITLTRSLSVQDGLNEMVDWMHGVEKDLKDHIQVPLNSSSIQEMITKNIILEQDITSRQSSINTINDKVNKFMETADPSTASSLQSKMNNLFQRFSKASEHAKERTAQMEDLKIKVELFEAISEEVHSFLDKKIQALSEADGPGKDVTELSQFMQETKCELIDHKKKLEDLHSLVEEFCVYGIPGDKAFVLEKVKTILKKFQDLEDTFTAKEEDVSSCQTEMDDFKSLIQSLKHWLTSFNNEIPTTAPGTLCVQELVTVLKKTKSLQVEWSQKGPDVQKVNDKGAVLCTLISTVTSPAKSRTTVKPGRAVVNSDPSSETKEHLTNKELATVQKHVSDVNKNYQHLGDILKTQASDLERRISQMQQVQEETDTLLQWFSKMHAVTSEWEPPTDSEAVKSQIEQHKLFSSELKQKESSVEMLKDKLKQLLVDYPDAQESSRWKEIMNKIDLLWKEINLLVAERQQTLEESSNDLIKFQTAEAQLKQWLIEKELMASVLGPLSIDPNMLKTQKQQVQILLKEFDARKHQYEQFNSTGQKILNRPCELPNGDKAVTDQLASIESKWTSLAGHLNDRCNRIDQAIVKSTEYQNHLKSLSDKLSALSNTLNSNVVVSSQPDAVKETLETARQIQEDLHQEMKNIENTKVLCQELSDLVAEEYLKAELNRQLDNIVKPFLELEQKAGLHVDLLQSAFASSQTFHLMSKDLQSWIQTKAKEQNEAAPISAKLEILKSQITEQSELQKALKDQCNAYEKIVREADSLLQNTEGEEKANLLSQLTMLKNNWEDINKKVLERKNKLVECEQKATKYKELVENVQPWIKECQNKLSEFQLFIDIGAVDNSIGQIKLLQKNVDKQRGMMETLNSAAECLLNSCQTDKEAVKEENNKMNNEVESLIENLHTKKDKMEKMGMCLKDFHESINDTEKQLTAAQEHLESHNLLGPQACSHKHLNFMQTQQKILQNLQPQIDVVKGLAQEIVVDIFEADGASDLLLQVDSLQKKHQLIHQQIEEKCSFLETKLQGIGHFQNSIREMFSQFAELDDELDSMAPIGRDLVTLGIQKQDIIHFLNKLSDLIATNKNANKTCKKTLATESSPDLIGIRRDLEALNKQCNKLLDRAKSREEQIDSNVARIEEFYSALTKFVDLLKVAEEHEESQGTVGMETDIINQQLKYFTTFQKEEIEPLQAHLQEVNLLGQSLVQTDGKDINTESLEHDLEDVNMRWNSLNKKVADRAAQLQEALLHCGRFQDALESILSWLTDTEDLVANQKPPSAEFKVVKAQLQEQKLLQRLLNDRKPTVDVIKREGEKIANSADQADKEKILNQLTALEHRWDQLLKKAEIRTHQLDGILVVAEQFHDSLEPLSEWLTCTEKKLANSEPVGTQTGKLLQQISQQKLLQEDIVLRKQNVDQAIQNGTELLKQSTGDEVVIIQEKLDGIKSRYADITKLSTGVSKILDKALHLATRFHSTHEELIQWLDKVEKELKEYETCNHAAEELSNEQKRKKELKEEATTNKKLLDSLNEVSSALLELVPWRAREGLDRMVTEDNERYRLVSDTVKQMVEEMDAARVRSQQFEQAVNTEYSWIEEAENKIKSMGHIRLEQDQTTAQLHLQKKGVFSWRELCSSEPFWETYEELSPWLVETEKVISQLPAPALDYDTLKEQQENIRQLRELIAEHKPHIDKMNKTGPQLLELSPEEGFFIQEKYVSADALYGEIKEVVKKRAIDLDEAISQSSQFHDKIDPTLESLQRIAERLRQPPSISAECEKIKEQISENKNVSVELEKLQPVYETLKMRGEEMIARSEGADKDISAKAVQDKLDQMVFIWEDIQALTEEREAQLLDVLELAEKFWCDHYALIATFKDTQDFIRELDGPGVDPSVVKQQQETAEMIKEEIDGLQDELDAVIGLGCELISACGEPDKPVVNKNIDERVDKLDEAMQAAVQYQDGLQALFDWVDIATFKLESMSPIGTDLETVKQQIGELKQFKTDAYQQQIELERLNHQKELLLKKVTEENVKQTVEDPLLELKLLWGTLEDKIINRQHKLEGALLALGPFQHALDELLTWMTHTEELLNEQKSTGGDPKTIEIELAKHHVLQNDVLAHKSTVKTVMKAGNDLIESSAGEEASNLQSRLEVLNQRWQDVLDKTDKRMKLLDSALFQAQGFHSEIEEMHQWLTDTERHLLASKPFGGLPETAREQLNTHLELYSAFEVKEEIYKRLMQKSQQIMEHCTDDPEVNVDQDIINLKEKWESVDTKLNERKAKLEEALELATGFHNSLQDFINWLTQAEQTLNIASPPSLILDTTLFQIDEHKVFVTEVNSHRDQILDLDKTGTHLKYFSQKQDVILIKNLLISVQSRWENVVQRSVERGRVLDDARKRSKQFHEAFDKLMEWLEESEKALDSELEIANDPDKIKTQLAMHKEFQKTLGGKHTVYDTTTRSGRSLKEKASLTDDIQKLDDMLSEIRDKWDTVCGKSVERQNKLEEALLFSGQFTDALQSLIDWLYRVEPQLAEDQPVHGDIDVVMNLIDNHKVFQKELGKRSNSIQALKRSSRELIDGSRDDSSWVKAQMQELGTRWETVCNLSVSKQTRLEEALRQAESFHSAVHVLLEWLAEAEQTLRFHGILPDEEDSLLSLLEQHKEFMRKIEEKRNELTKGASMGEAILSVCHPDSITTIKHWITIIRARFEEVLTWAKQHRQRLALALEDVISKKELLESLLAWLKWSEMTLNEKDKEDIPQDIDEVKALIEEHQAFMEEMTQKQPDVDKVTKTYKRKAVESSSVQSQIPILDKGRAGRKRSPTQSLYPSGAQTSLETKNPRVNLLVSKWQQVWLLALERRRNLNDALDRLEELREFANFDFDVWRKKYMRWMNHKKSRVMDFFRRIDKDQDGKITRQEFIDGILSSKFPTSRLEMSAVADIFDRDGDGYIDYYEFVAALHPNKDAYKPVTDADKIEDEVTRQVAKCKCAKRFQVEQIGENKYRFFLGNQFGDSQQLRLVRILRSTVMVRVGGGWMALDEFLVKNDPCRAKGRTNVELREKFMLPDGVSQTMSPFRPKGRRSRPSSRGASPNRSNSSPNIPACTSLAASSSTPKANTIQGSKLRLPGYLSGKEFHSAVDGSILTTAATKVRTQFAAHRKTPSRAGSKAGSRSSSRRGSDASDFDISEIPSACTDMPETVANSSRPSPRASPRSGIGKPSKIPTPQRRSPINKLNKLTKR
ncbi:hypothetical protein GDO86_009892 [Hymenochirus boettgeri]|uniref:Dystonin n=1 Tax=Hymenochirus boettgeri TaxID=247094 RepID=A0A8T2JME2_9PIPI|nr:hypothetical protein GDO86_009892 [Hymenochirus boettgeri]